MPSTPGVPGGALPFSGPIDLASINAEWGLGTDLTQYHGIKWYYDGNLTYGYFGGSTIKVSDFRGKRATDPAGNGIYFSNASGSGSYTASLYRNSFTIEIWGGGGSGGGGNGGTGGNGGDSSTLGVTAGGGQGGQPGSIPVPPPPVDVTVRGRGGIYEGPQDEHLSGFGVGSSPVGFPTSAATNSAINNVANTIRDDTGKVF
jgi:hypothetical protein